MSTFPKQLVVVAASSLLVAATLTVPVAQAATCQAQNATSGAVSADLQAVIDAADSGDTIYVAGACNGGFVIDKTLTVERARNANRAVLDGDGADRVLTITGSRDSGINVFLNQLTITHGSAARGGGVFMRRAFVRLVSSAVVGNQAAQGGGIYSSGRGGWLELRRTLIGDNQATYLLRRGHEQILGGGVYSEGAVSLRDSTVHGNVTAAKRPQGHGAGGGIYARLVGVSHQSVVHGNIAAFGGGISAHRVVLFEGASVSRNIGYRHGGGVLIFGTNEPGSLKMLNRTRVVGNTADRGGGVYAEDARVVLTDEATISRNTAEVDGGGVLSEATCVRHPIAVREGATISKNVPNNIAIVHGC